MGNGDCSNTSGPVDVWYMGASVESRHHSPSTSALRNMSRLCCRSSPPSPDHVCFIPLASWSIADSRALWLSASLNSFGSAKMEGVRPTHQHHPLAANLLSSLSVGSIAIQISVCCSDNGEIECRIRSNPKGSPVFAMAYRSQIRVGKKTRLE